MSVNYTNKSIHNIMNSYAAVSPVAGEEEPRVQVQWAGEKGQVQGGGHPVGQPGQPGLGSLGRVTHSNQWEGWVTDVSSQ